MITYLNENNGEYYSYDSIVHFVESSIDIDTLCEYIDEQFEQSCIFSEQYIIEAAADKNFNKMFNSGAKSKIDSAAKDITRIIKTNGCTEESKKSIRARISDLFNSMVDFISLATSKMFNDKKLKDADKGKIRKSCVLLVYVVIINTLAINVLAIFAGSIIGSAIGAIVVAPIVEESAKIISVKGGYSKEFFIVFNAFEFTSYITKPTSIPFANAVRGRTLCVGIHGLNTVIHKILLSKKKVDENNKDAVQKEKENATTLTFVIGCIIHGTWNAAACFSPKFTNVILGLDG